VRIHTSADSLDLVRPAATLGTFDGVHLGHRRILDALRREQARLGGESVVLTLWPHPRTVVSPGSRIEQLSTLEEKQELLAGLGVDHLVILPFTPEFSRLTACDFVREYIVRKVGAHALVVGYNHRFGRDRQGDIEYLRQCPAAKGLELVKVEAISLPGLRLSSTGIREALAAGRPEEARQMLGYPYALRAQVVPGQQLGRTLGFPTANLRPLDPDKLIPARGVYAVSLEWQGRRWKGMANLGTRPTLGVPAEEPLLEAHLFDFDGDLYGQTVTLAFERWIRPERKFDDLPALRRQLLLDSQQARRG